MKSARLTLFHLLLAGAGAACFISPAAAKTAIKKPAKPAPVQKAAPSLWVSAYYANWVQEAGVLTPEKIDYSAFSHLIHFHVIPANDGTIDPVKSITEAESAALLAPAHAAGRKVLLCVGGGDTGAAFRSAISEEIRPRFITTLVTLATSRGYDGLDIDMEPIEDVDVPNYEAFIHELHAQMKLVNPDLLLTCAISSQAPMFGRLAPEFDQVNAMTYDQAGLWDGWKTWFNSALYNGGERRLNAVRAFPSVSDSVRDYLLAGIPRTKLGIGLAFYGYAWTGADGPNQSTQGVKVDAIEYYNIMDKYDNPERRRWDNGAHAPYLSVEATEGSDRKFISFDNELLITQKIDYARKQHLGGLIIWELGSGYRDSQPEGKKDVLLQSVKHAWRTPATQLAASPNL
ncbi:hypothetical protein CCAX7_30380 [Capsulimonas corticalis]|uniref:chitinase n=1 Tax=Capsulimonas corticalis TaxID=2219043 RepID=A0A9N7L3K9_9BACT|nr:glycoside hydrolase family 18 protein [Capsulimonas corticalis]BDI30987.1 hypothetical protein CCAX7_30380 [Capsulimonas corticalis]